MRKGTDVVILLLGADSHAAVKRRAVGSDPLRPTADMVITLVNKVVEEPDGGWRLKYILDCGPQQSIKIDQRTAGDVILIVWVQVMRPPTTSPSGP